MEPVHRPRPRKTFFSNNEQKRLRTIAIEKIRTLLLPNEGIDRIILIGSSVKGTFGSYEAPGFRGSLFSDFDFIVFVKDDYIIPAILEREPDGKPFGKPELDLAYRQKLLVENTYDAEIFFVRESSLDNEAFRKEAEAAGIPVSETSAIPNIPIYTSQK